MSRWEKPKDYPENGPLFQSAMARKSDPETSKEAAGAISPRLGKLQRRVLWAYEVHGPMTAKELERLPAFAHLSPSTARKRASELVASGHLEQTDERRDRCFVLRVAD